ncbi:MAG: arsenical pump-driving ATPase [Pseudobdellovibrionaceae bacterium]|nr:MAG: arsenical pump-driving ATPase [Pseudobdellovibrionaceae bacterium]
MAVGGDNQRLVLVTGKGGVGKSLVAAARAHHEFRQGQRVLLVELGETSSYQFMLNMAVDFTPRPSKWGFDVALWSGETCLREYIRHFVKLDRVVDLFFDNKVMRTFIKAAPALKELAILGKLTSGIRHWGPPLHYDVIILDGYSTGHFLALLQAPRGMADLVQFGPMGEQSQLIHDTITNPDFTEIDIVTLPEEMPTTETMELFSTLMSDFSVTPNIIGNRWLEPHLTDEELTHLEVHLSHQDGPEWQQPLDFVNYLQIKMKRQKESEQALSALAGHLKYLPLVFSSDSNFIIESLSSQWGGQHG